MFAAVFVAVVDVAGACIALVVATVVVLLLMLRLLLLLW